MALRKYFVRGPKMSSSIDIFFNEEILLVFVLHSVIIVTFFVNKRRNFVL